MDMLTDNPCRGVFRRKKMLLKRSITRLKKLKSCLKLLKGESLKYQVFFNLAIYSAFRRGELLGLEWEDI